MTPADIFDAAYQAEVSRYRIGDYIDGRADRFVYSPNPVDPDDDPMYHYDASDNLAAERYIRDRGFEAGMRALAEDLPESAVAAYLKKVWSIPAASSLAPNVERHGICAALLALIGERE